MNNANKLTAGAKGPFAGVKWNAYHPLELQLAEKLCTLQIATQAEILYGVNDWHDGWSHALSRKQFRSPHYNQQVACTSMVERFQRLNRIRQILDVPVYCEQEQSEIYTLMAELLKRSLLASERGRTRALVYQLGPGYLRPETALSLKQFDLEDKVNHKHVMVAFLLIYFGSCHLLEGCSFPCCRDSNVSTRKCYVLI